MAFDLSRVLRSLLFASPGSISVKDIQAVFTRFHEEAANTEADSEVEPVPAEGEDASTEVSAEVEGDADSQPSEDGEAAATAPSEVPSLITATQIREAMDAIAAQLKESNQVYRLQETHQGWRLVTAPDCADWVRLLRNQPKPMRLSQSAMETLAIIAYRQPVVRSEIESIRGVSVDSAINRLLERELIHIVGRADLPGRPIQYGTTEAFLEFIGIKSIEELPASDVLSAREIDVWLKKHEEQHPVADSDVGLDTESGDETADLEVAPEPEPEPEPSREADAAESNEETSAPGATGGEAEDVSESPAAAAAPSSTSTSESDASNEEKA